MLAVVGRAIEDMSAVADRTSGALSRANVKVMAVAPGPSECVVPFVVPQPDLKAALAAAHREFELGVPRRPAFPARSPHAGSAAWYRSSDRPGADGPPASPAAIPLAITEP